MQRILKLFFLTGIFVPISFTGNSKNPKSVSIIKMQFWFPEAKVTN